MTETNDPKPGFIVTFEYTDDEAQVQFSQHEVNADGPCEARKEAEDLPDSPDGYDSVDVEELPFRGGTMSGPYSGSISGGEGPRIDVVDELVADFTDHHGFTVQEQGLVLAEETGEACEEILKLNDGKVTKDNSNPDIRGEIGDVLYTVWTIAYLTGTDPVEALLETADKNVQRTESGQR